jgi:hypothetical protein
VDDVTGISSLSNNNLSFALTNPVRNTLHLFNPDNIPVQKLHFYTSLGMNVFETSTSAQTKSVNVSELLPGVYIVRVVVQGKEDMMFKIIKK